MKAINITNFFAVTLVMALASCANSNQKPLFAISTDLPFDYESNAYTYGKVKTIKSKFFEIEEKFGEQVISDIYELSIESFNEDGIVTKMTLYDEDGDPSNRYETTIEKDKITILDTSSKYKKGSQRIFKLNSKREIITQNYIDPEYGFDYTYHYEYENGNIVSCKEESGNRNFTYYYSDNGTLVRKHNITRDGEHDITYKIEKDKKGNIIKISESGTSYPEMVEYSDFDKNGNWTKAIIYDEDEAYELIQREIEYY